jgi:hypothetical protein
MQTGRSSLMVRRNALLPSSGAGSKQNKQNKITQRERYFGELVLLGVWLTLWSCRYKQYASPKRRHTSTGLYDTYEAKQNYTGIHTYTDSGCQSGLRNLANVGFKLVRTVARKWANVVGWGTMLQAGRAMIGFLMKTNGVINWLLASNRNKYQVSSRG